MLQRKWSDEVDLELKNKKELLHQAVGWEAELLFQRTRMQWISEGDKSSKFFHTLIRGRRARNKISLQGEEDNVVKDPRIIREMVVSHFGDLFMNSRYQMNEELFIDYPRTVTAEMNVSLCQLPTEAEVWEGACSMSVDSAPGEDGFIGHFFKVCWDIIKMDMVEMASGFIQGDYLHRDISITLLTLIPKIEKLKSLADYHPISLASFTSKLISKIMAYRLATIFCHKKMVADLDRKIDGGNVILKFDMSKAYDRVQ